eukprot:COSAG02_NODE_20896_length_811_cov_1.304775_1_plen_137_part_10
MRRQPNRLLARHTDEKWGTIAVGERLLLKLDGGTARILKSATLAQLREIGSAGLEFAGAAAVGDGDRVIARYKYSSVLECWSCKAGLVVWRHDLGSDIKQLQMAPDGSRAVAGTATGKVAWIRSDEHTSGHESDSES